MLSSLTFPPTVIACGRQFSVSAQFEIASRVIANAVLGGQSVELGEDEWRVLLYTTISARGGDEFHCAFNFCWLLTYRCVASCRCPIYRSSGRKLIPFSFLAVGQTHRRGFILLVAEQRQPSTLYSGAGRRGKTTFELASSCCCNAKVKIAKSPATSSDRRHPQMHGRNCREVFRPVQAFRASGSRRTWRNRVIQR